MQIEKRIWGQLNGENISLFTIKNKEMTIAVTDYGCTVTQILLPDHQGKIDDVVLGFDKLQPYLDGHPFFGSIAGRFANRIKDGRFQLNGKEYQLATNEAPTGQHLHGGSRGFDKYIWDSEIIENADMIGVLFTRISPDGEEGYPGNLSLSHLIALTNDNKLIFDFKATTDQDTIINLVNHSYYNLQGAKNGNIEEQFLQIFADEYTPVDNATMIPTGAIESVVGSGLDFREATAIGLNMDKIAERAIDNNFIIRGKTNAMNMAAILYDPQSQRKMEVSTNLPAIQFYNGFKLSNKDWYGKKGQKYEKFDGLCLETQYFPNSPNEPRFSPCILKKNEEYHTVTIHQFSWGN